MTENELITLRKSIEEVAAKHPIIKSEYYSIVRELGIESADAMKERLETLERKNRLLKVGIVGRVKAGKSSLINALLFNGESVLPAAATPMTAALTILTYAPEFSVEAEFFTADDIKAIKANYELYVEKHKIEKAKHFESLKNRIKTEITENLIHELTGKAEKSASFELRNETVLTAAFEQYQKIKQSTFNVSVNKQELKAKSITELQKFILDYVGHDGKYMPFTKSITVKMPNESIKDLMIIDTPGINDVVQSREERTRELLKECDAILTISPTGQFLSKEDTDLMDRITSKDGIREIHIVATQVDNQLYGSEKQENNGILPDVLNGIKTKLGNQMHSVFSQMKENNPEVQDAYDQLINQGKDRVIYSSAICYTMLQTFDDKKNWSENLNHVWKLLSTNYPDIFSSNAVQAKEALKMLANISAIEAIIERIRERKADIIKKAKEEYLLTKARLIKSLYTELNEKANEQISKIQSTNLDELKKKKKGIEANYKKNKGELTEDFQDVIKNLEITLQKELTKLINSNFAKSFKDIDENRSNVQKFYTTGWWLWKETHSYNETTLRAGAVRDSINGFLNSIVDETSLKANEIVKEWRTETNYTLIGKIRDLVGDGNLDTSIIRKSIRIVLDAVIFPDFEKVALPGYLNEYGTLTGSQAETFAGKAKEFVSNQEYEFKNKIKVYAKEVKQNLSKCDFVSEVFNDYLQEVEDLEAQIKDNANSVNQLNKFITDFKNIPINE